jgi:hypothetical protein
MLVTCTQQHQTELHKKEVAFWKEGLSHDTDVARYHSRATRACRAIAVLRDIIVTRHAHVAQYQCHATSVSCDMSVSRAWHVAG